MRENQLLQLAHMQLKCNTDCGSIDSDSESVCVLCTTFKLY